jgi:hypothetical protein
MDSGSRLRTTTSVGGGGQEPGDAESVEVPPQQHSRAGGRAPAHRRACWIAELMGEQVRQSGASGGEVDLAGQHGQGGESSLVAAGPAQRHALGRVESVMMKVSQARVLSWPVCRPAMRRMVSLGG